ncbi:sulfatase [Verrucomicrobiota bacterium]
MNRRLFLKISLSGTAGAVLPSVGIAGTAVKKPNIIYINVDDLGWADLGCQGSGFYETPNIDKLASQGMVFSDAYAPAANCAPSRACCLTGQYTPRHGVYTVNNSARGSAKERKLIPTKNTLHIEDSNLTIAHALKAAGYKTCTVGKWHVSEDPLKNGFDVNIAGGKWGGPYHGGYHSPYDYPNCKKEGEGEYLTDRLTSEAIRFITENRDRPFFLYLPYYTVHSPLQAKKDKERLFGGKKGTKAHKDVKYAAMIASLDEGVGRLMETVKALGLADNSLILFTSDNGGVWKTSKQWPLRAGKGSYYEGGIREPLLVRWPGKIKPGTTCDVPVSGVDFFPTFLEVTAGEKPTSKVLDGVSLMPLLTQSGAIKDRPLFWHFPIYLQGGSSESRDPKFRTRPGSVIRYGDWKLHEYFEDGGLELYNLKDDIGEKKNLADTNPEKVKELHEMLKAWRKQTNAPVPTKKNPKYKI